jgi:hypothetical protein
MQIRIDLFTLMLILIRILLFTLIGIQILLIKVMGICDYCSLDLLWLYLEPPGLHYKRPRLYFEPLKLLNFDSADPDPGFHSNADPDLVSENNADPEGQPYFQDECL